MGKSLLELEAAFRERYPQKASKEDEIQSEKTVAQESENSKEVKRFGDIQAKQVEKPVSSVKDFRDIQPKQETKEVSSVRDFRDIQPKQETKAVSSVRDSWDIQSKQETKADSGVRDFRDIQSKQKTKADSGVRDFRDIQPKQETKAVSGVRDFRDIQPKQETKAVSGVRDFRDIQPKQETKTVSGVKDFRNIQPTKSVKGTEESKDLSHVQPMEKGAKSTGIKIFKASPRAFLVSEILFYFSLVSIILCTVLFSGGLLGDRALGGRRFIEMSTSSMESVYSKGSLLIVQEVEPSELKVGDDISFVKDALVSVTHRIVEVREDEETNTYTFVTQGVDNPSDGEEVLAGNVIGRVEESISGIGSVLSGVTRNLNYIIGVFVAFMVASFAIKLFWREGAPQVKRELVEG